MTIEKIAAIRDNINRRLIGKNDAIHLVLCALLCRGHVLIEDVPGTGKTTLAQSLAQSIGCSFRRIQFTPDVMPSDITGFSMLDSATGQFAFHPGVIFNNIILADEINRTSPKTQSALLEVMQEGQATVDGVSYEVPNPFMVLATQNPVEYVGTFQLPEAQLDRFFIRVKLGYPSQEEEAMILDRHDAQYRPPALEEVADTKDILELQAETDGIHTSPALKGYIAAIIAKTREHEDVMLGISPRGAIFLMHAAKGHAYLAGRKFATPDDVQKMAEPVLGHRLLLTPEARLKSYDASRIIAQILESTPLPEG
ncbi:MAG: MoxR family ATPase [Clostridiales bacterium]|nr:MoxR family ATPase [Clostridiales bacterium]